MYSISCHHINAWRPLLMALVASCRKSSVLPLLSHPGLASAVENAQGVIGVGSGTAPAVPSAVRDHRLSHICGHGTALQGTGWQNQGPRSGFKSVTSFPTRQKAQRKEVRVSKECERSGRRKWESKIMKTRRKLLQRTLSSMAMADIRGKKPKCHKMKKDLSETLVELQNTLG